MRTDFLPSLHGFSFVNSFSGLPIPFSRTGEGLATILSRSKLCYGLCGGMSSAAYDFFTTVRAIPLTKTVPELGSPLYRYLFRRQLDTYGPFGMSVAKFAQWMALPDSEVQKRTYVEFQKIRTQLDRTQAVVLGLVYVNFVDTLAIWLNHQVLAYGYSEVEAQTIDINIYDPNFPRRDDVVIEARREFAGFRCTQKVAGVVNRKIRGFFVMPYSPIEPPTLL